MATGAERQRALRARQKESCTRLDIMLPNKDAELVAHNSKAVKLTKAAYVSMLINAKGSESPGKEESLLQHNSVLVSERDRAIAELRVIKDKLAGKERVIIQQKTEMNTLKSKVNKAGVQALGQGAYRGDIPLSIAITLLSFELKKLPGINKQTSVRNEAKMKCGYSDITETSLTEVQRVEIYEYIKNKYK